MVHSSLSSLGYVVGGAATIISVLKDWNPGGTLAMPAHSYCYPNDDGSTPVFDPRSTSSRVGAITDTFWRQSGVRRSIHPTHSLACLGPQADHLISDHALCDTPCGKGTPYERLAHEDAAVLMFGASLDSYTLFHTAEDAAQVPYLYQKKPVKLRFLNSTDGNPQVLNMKRQDMGVARRFRDMAPWLEERGLLFKARCGKGDFLFIPHAAAAHEQLVQALRSDPWMLVEASARPH
jgi:aminoglycoside 3-N-acetyltransferase